LTAAPMGQRFGAHVGPVVALQTVRYIGTILAYLLLAVSLRHEPSDPAAVLNAVFSGAALAQGACFFRLLWEEG